MSSREEYGSELRNECSILYANFSRYALDAWLAAIRPASLTDLPRLPMSRRPPECRSPAGERSSGPTKLLPRRKFAERPSVHLIGTAIDAKGYRGACATGISGGRERELELSRAQR